jgi:DHA1 family multidrug resistance protein-like MFS transporter
MSTSNKTMSKSPRILLPIIAFTGDFVLGILIISVPLYAYSIGATPLEIGLIGASVGILYCFGPLVMGSIADRIGYYNSIVIATLTGGIVSLSYTLVENPFVFIFMRLPEALFWSLLWPSVTAAFASSEMSLRKSMRNFNTTWSLGQSFGLFTAGFLITIIGIRGPFYASSVILFSTGVSVLILSRRVGWLSRDSDTPTQVGPSNNGNSFIGQLTLVIASVFVAYFVVNVLTNFFPPFGIFKGLSVFEVSIIAFIFGLTRTLSFFLIGTIRFRISVKKLLQISVPLLGIAPLFIWFELGRLGYYVSFLAAGILTGLSYACGQIILMEAAGLKKARFAGIFESSIGLGTTVGPLIGGLFASSDLKLPYLLCSFVGITFALFSCFITLRKKIKNYHKHTISDMQASRGS